MGSKRNLPALAGRQSDGNDFVAPQWGNGLTFVLYAVYRIAHHAPGMVQVQPSLVVAVVCVTGHSDIQVAKGLIRHTHILAGTKGHYLVVGQLLGLFVLALEDELAYLGQCLLGIGIHHLVGLTRPDGLFVQLDMFHGRRTEHHATDDTIAYW